MRWYFLGGIPGDPVDGTFIYCAFDIETLLRPSDPQPIEGTFIYCAFDIETLPRP